MSEQAKQKSIEKVTAAIRAIRQGEMVIIMDDKSRENEGDLVMAAEKATPELTNFMIKMARGLVCVPMASVRAEQLKLMPMVVNNEDRYKTAFTVSVDHKSLTTGISAFERCKTINELASPKACGEDFHKPGHIFPLVAKDGGVFERRGHTEASVDIVKLAGLKPVAAICEIIKDNGEMAREPDLIEFAEKHQLLLLNISDIVAYREHTLAPQSSAKLPTEYGNFRIFSFMNKSSNEPHLALVKEGTDFSRPVTIRIHSECLTGDVFHSLKCDCRHQLDYGLQAIAKADNGILLYLRQEGRGIGLVEKLKAYALQDGGLNTIDANVRLGHDVDERTYEEAVKILNYFNVKRVNIITNNQDKVAALKVGGIVVEQQIPTPRFETAANRDYLNVKERCMGHHFRKSVKC